MVKRHFVVATFALVAWSCFGFDERLAACRRQEGVCAVLDGGEADAGCAPVTKDLLFNGSFERTTDAGIPGWSSTAPVIHHPTGGAHCQAWVEQSTANTEMLELDGDFDLSAAAPAGTRFRVSGWVKSLDQNPMPITVQLRVRSGGYRPARTQRIDPTWTFVSLELDLIEMGERLAVEIVTDGPRAIGLDGFSVVQLP